MTQDEAMKKPLKDVYAALRFTLVGALTRDGDGVRGTFVYEEPGIRATFTATLSGSALKDLTTNDKSTTANTLAGAFGDCLEELIAERMLSK